MATIVTIVTTLQPGITRNWSKCLSDHKKLGGRCRCRVTGPWWWCDPCLPSRNKAKILKHPVAVGECYRVTLELILDCSPPPDLVAAMSVHWPRVACSCSCSCIYLWHYCLSPYLPLDCRQSWCCHHYHYCQHHYRNILISDFHWFQAVQWSVPLTLLATVSLASMLASSSPPLFSQSYWSFSCEF